MTSEILIKMSREDKHGLKTSAGGRAMGEDLWGRKDSVPLDGRKARAWSVQRGRAQLTHSLVNCVNFLVVNFTTSCLLESQSERNKKSRL